MRDLTPSEMDHLEAEFARLFPKQAKWRTQKRDVYTAAANYCFAGFKAGYLLAKEEAEGA